MKRLIIVVAVTALLAASCNEDDPAAPTPKPHPYSGTFDVDVTVASSDCRVVPPLDVLETVTVDKNSIDWGGIEGTWDEEEKRAHGVSAERCVPLHPVSGCMGCYVIRFDLTFASPDSFYGDVTVPYDYSDECTATDCTSTFDVTGVRMK